MSTYALRMIMITRLSFFLLFMWCSWPQTHEKCVGSWFLVGLSRYYFVSTFAADHIKFHADHLKSWWWTWKIRSPGSCFTKHESNINHQAWCFIHDDTTLARIKKDECFGKNVFVKPQKACNLKYETFYWGDSPPNNHQNYSQWSDLKIPFFWPFFILFLEYHKSLSCITSQWPVPWLIVYSIDFSPFIITSWIPKIPHQCLSWTWLYNVELALANDFLNIIQYLRTKDVLRWQMVWHVLRTTFAVLWYIDMLNRYVIWVVHIE